MKAKIFFKKTTYYTITRDVHTTDPLSILEEENLRNWINEEYGPADLCDVECDHMNEKHGQIEFIDISLEDE